MYIYVLLMIRVHELVEEFLLNFRSCPLIWKLQENEQLKVENAEMKIEAHVITTKTKEAQDAKASAHLLEEKWNGEQWLRRVNPSATFVRSVLDFWH